MKELYRMNRIRGEIDKLKPGAKNPQLIRLGAAANQDNSGLLSVVYQPREDVL